MQSPYPRKGVAFVLCAPSGTGKTTLAKRLIARYQRFTFSVSCTTRAPRTGEIDGKDYIFLDKAEFENKRANNFFAEWAEVHGNYYGTPLDATTQILDSGRDILFDIDVQGAAQLKQTMPEAYFVFLLPPSKDELERRLRLRGTDDDASIATRLRNAEMEFREAGWFNSWIINDNQEKAFQDLCSVYRAACMSPSRRPNFLQELLSQF